jgi:hypothetical protein
MKCSNYFVQSALVIVSLIVIPAFPDPATAQCQTVNGLNWCYHPTECGKACVDTCAEFGLAPVANDSIWLAAQDTVAECQAISEAFGLGTTVSVGSYFYACLEDQNDAAHPSTGLVAPLYCSDNVVCTANHRAFMDQQAVACGGPGPSGSRKSICPCEVGPSLTPTPTATATPTTTPTATDTPTPTVTVTATPTLSVTPTPDPTATATPVLDHFTCYQTGSTSGSVKFAGIPNPPGVHLAGLAMPGGPVEVKKSKYLCAPTNKLGEDPTAPLHANHLEGYPIKYSTVPTITLHIADQFNGSGLRISMKKPSHILVPTAKSLSGTPPTPTPLEVDHFACWKVTVAPGTPKFIPVSNVTVEDQFGPMTVAVKKPKFYCTPVNKNGEDPTAPDHAGRLMCYQVKQLVPPDPAKFAKMVGVFTNNQFAAETLDVKKPTELCVPAALIP